MINKATNKSHPKVSVIIPVYNVENYLTECIESVIAQTYKKTEILLIDDGSTDQSGKICNAYTKKYKNIKVFHKKNEGLGLTRNYGLLKATGDYIMFLDSDDYISSDMIKTLLDIVIKFNADICKCGFTRISDDRKISSIKQYDSNVYADKAVHDIFLPRFFGSSPTNKDSVEMSVCGTLYRGDIIRKNKIKFVSEREYLSEDIFFNIDYLMQAKVACVTDYIGYYYRYNRYSLTHSYKKDRFNKSKYLYEVLKKLIQEHGYSKPEMLRLSRLFFINIRCCLAQESKMISSSKQNVKKNISIICNDITVRKTIEEYPIHLLGIRQFIFLELVKKKMINTIYFMIKSGIIHE